MVAKLTKAHLGLLKREVTLHEENHGPVRLFNEKVLATQAWPPEFAPQTPHKGGRRELTPKTDFSDLHLHVIAHFLR